MSKQLKWDLKQDLLKQIKAQGGFVNTHSHLDRAYVITPETLYLGNASLQEKWSLVDDTKANSTVTQIYDRMAYGVEEMLKQGVKVMSSCIDVDGIVKDKSIQAATKLK